MAARWQPAAHEVVPPPDQRAARWPEYNLPKMRAMFRKDKWASLHTNHGMSLASWHAWLKSVHLSHSAAGTKSNHRDYACTLRQSCAFTFNVDEFTRNSTETKAL